MRHANNRQYNKEKLRGIHLLARPTVPLIPGRRLLLASFPLKFPRFVLFVVSNKPFARQNCLFPVFDRALFAMDCEMRKIQRKQPRHAAAHRPQPDLRCSKMY